MTEKEMLEVFEAKRAEVIAAYTEALSMWTKAMGNDEIKAAEGYAFKAVALRDLLTKVYGINF